MELICLKFGQRCSFIVLYPTVILMDIFWSCLILMKLFFFFFFQHLLECLACAIAFWFWDVVRTSNVLWQCQHWVCSSYVGKNVWLVIRGIIEVWYWTLKVWQDGREERYIFADITWRMRHALGTSGTPVIFCVPLTCFCFLAYESSSFQNGESLGQNEMPEINTEIVCAG